MFACLIFQYCIISVLIWVFLYLAGHGNSAFETADAIYGHASVVHIAGRSRVRLAWETHYVGDLRCVRGLIVSDIYIETACSSLTC